jgi:hypothetical protein
MNKRSALPIDDRDEGTRGLKRVKPSLPDPEENHSPSHTENPPPNKRRHTRHRYSSAIEIWREHSDSCDAMTFEISEGGLSAATRHTMRVGEKVELCPVLGYRLTAVIRHKTGAIYGFEFVGLSEEQRNAIRTKCQDLPPFVSLIDI